MPIYKPSELHLFLNQLGIAPKKGLSQNFLIDRNILKKIVATADVQPGDVVLEVGPGPGSLTEELLLAGAHVVAVEKDPILANALHRLQRPDQSLEVHCQDVMTCPLQDILAPHLIGGKKAKVIANLPYHLTTPIIAELIPQNHLFSTLVLMVQDEVARRFTASPSTSAYSSFTVFLNFYSTPRYAFTVNSSCFYPKPKVNSAIVALSLHEPPHVSSQENFFKLTRTAFEHRRKMLRGSLRELYAPKAVEQALVDIRLSAQARPEELSLEQFLQFFELLQH